MVNGELGNLNSCVVPALRAHPQPLPVGGELCSGHYGQHELSCCPDSYRDSCSMFFLLGITEISRNKKSGSKEPL
jgi:hypothetical protein